MNEHLKATKIVKQGNITDVTIYSRKNNKQNILRLNKDEYLIISTGEIVKAKKKDSRMDVISSLKRSMNELRQLINANTPKPSNCLMVTLTYKENMQDQKKLYHDYRNFTKELRKDYNFEYIAAAEPQERGAWHLHIIVIFQNKTYIDNNLIAKLWGKGFTTTKRMDECDNLGAYFTAYMQNLYDEHDNSRQKKAKKYKRLYLYPPGFRFYRYSKGIKKPQIIHTTEQKISEHLPQNSTLTYSKTKELIIDDKDPLVIEHRQYSTTAKNKQPKIIKLDTPTITADMLKKALESLKRGSNAVKG